MKLIKNILEFSKDPISLLLLFVPVNTHSWPSIPPHHAGQLVRLPLGLCEDQHLGCLVRPNLFKESGEFCFLLVFFAYVDNLDKYILLMLGTFFYLYF